MIDKTNEDSVEVLVQKYFDQMTEDYETLGEALKRGLPTAEEWDEILGTFDVDVENLTWDANASKRNIESATRQMVGAIEKGIGRVSTDVQRGSERVVAAVKDGTGKVADTIKRTNNSTESANSTAPTSATEAIQTGLRSVAASAHRVAEHIGNHPTELGWMAESGKAVGEQFSKLIQSAERFAESADDLKMATEETQKAAEWLGSNSCGGGRQCIPVNNSFGRVVGSFQDLQ